MLRLTPRPKSTWSPINLDEETSFAILIERPTYGQILAAQAEAHPAARVAARLGAISDWRGVETAGDKPAPVPFSADALADLLHNYEGAVEALLVALKPYFERTETDTKNLPTPPSAATSTTPPSADLSNSGDSPPLPTACA